MKYIIACIYNDVDILDELYNKISRIVDNDYIIESYVNAEQALIGCYNNIIAGNEILITLIGSDSSSMSVDNFIVELYKNSPHTKNILFQDAIDMEVLTRIINSASVYQIIPKIFNRIDFELIILEAIKQNAEQRRLNEYQKVLESAVDKRTKELNDINVKLKVLATTDSLTNVNNRRSFFESCGPMIKFLRREKRSLAILMIDIDRFKQINDRFGHAVGDEVIKSMAQKTREILRKSDIFARLGGEEFAATLPNTTKRGAMTVAENIRKDIEAHAFTTLQGETIKYTVSIGVAMLTYDDEDLESILHRADLALYDAKRTGRNCIVLQPSESIEI